MIPAAITCLLAISAALPAAAFERHAAEQHFGSGPNNAGTVAPAKSHTPTQSIEAAETEDEPSANTQHKSPQATSWNTLHAVCGLAREAMRYPMLVVGAVSALIPAVDTMMGWGRRPRTQDTGNAHPPAGDQPIPDIPVEPVAGTSPGRTPSPSINSESAARSGPRAAMPHHNQTVAQLLDHHSSHLTHLQQNWSQDPAIPQRQTIVEEMRKICGAHPNLTVIEVGHAVSVLTDEAMSRACGWPRATASHAQRLSPKIAQLVAHNPVLGQYLRTLQPAESAPAAPSRPNEVAPAAPQISPQKDNRPRKKRPTWQRKLQAAFKKGALDTYDGLKKAAPLALRGAVGARAPLGNHNPSADKNSPVLIDPAALEVARQGPAALQLAATAAAMTTTIAPHSQPAPEPAPYQHVTPLQQDVNHHKHPLQKRDESHHYEQAEIDVKKDRERQQSFPHARRSDSDNDDDAWDRADDMVPGTSEHQLFSPLLYKSHRGKPLDPYISTAMEELWDETREQSAGEDAMATLLTWSRLNRFVHDKKPKDLAEARKIVREQFADVIEYNKE